MSTRLCANSDTTSRRVASSGEGRPTRPCHIVDLILIVAISLLMVPYVDCAQPPMYPPQLGSLGKTPGLVPRAIGFGPQILPSLTLSLNQASFRPGETLILTATTTPGAPRPVDVYLAVELPDGKLLFFQ